MDFIKKLTRGFSSFAFKVLILLAATVTALVFTFHSPKKIEKSLDQSGVYTTFVNSALEEVNKSNTSGDTSTNVPTADPAIKEAISKAFTPTLLKQSTESVLNGTYSWLQGKTTTPDFKIDLTEAKQSFAVAVGQAAYNRVVALPTCSLAQLKTLSTTDIDPFIVPCKPAGMDLKAQQSKVTNDIATSKEFIGTPILTAQNLPKDSQGKTVFDQIKDAPKLYKWINSSPWIIFALAILAAGVCVLLYDSKRRGLRNIAIGLIDASVVLIAGSLFVKWLVNKASSPGGALSQSTKGSFQQSAIKGVGSITNSFEQTVIWICGIYLFVGAVVLLVLYITRPDDEKKKKDKSAPKTPEVKTPQSKPPTSKPTPKPIQG